MSGDEPTADYRAVFWDIGGVILDPESVRRAHEAFVERLVEEYVPERSPDDAGGHGPTNPRSQAHDDAGGHGPTNPRSQAHDDAGGHGPTNPRSQAHDDAAGHGPTNSRSQAHEDAIATWRAAVGSYFREREGTEFRSARTGYDRAVAEIVGEAVPEDEWLPLFEAVTTETLRPEPGAVEAIERLADSDRHVGVVSDVDTEEGLRILETFGVRDRFDSITTSEMVGRTKPDAGCSRPPCGRPTSRRTRRS
ncbi:HAD family hydrolase [Halorussus sp. MSC15.2]|uniref:HAD family hydrolase n=1 Tax=Halorussus sp. MSC15.2 TaxID=2283638 RepID=UPI0028150A75|nr:HAD family hydrolase [Halorussus sp. MSC15.2]